eukprot:10552756-Prorocentrum_lima.AAC.1
MSQQIVLVEQQQVQSWSVEWMKVAEMQRDLEDRLPAEQNHQTRALIEAISGHVREKRTPENVA